MPKQDGVHLAKPLLDFVEPLRRAVLAVTDKGLVVHKEVVLPEGAIAPGGGSIIILAAGKSDVARA